MTLKKHPTRRLVILATAAAGAWVGCAIGCSSDGSDGGGGGGLFGSSSSPNTNTSQTQGGNQNEPMTILEKRRLLARYGERADMVTDSGYNRYRVEILLPCERA